MDEEDVVIKTQALNSLVGVVDQFWTEISDYVGKMYVASEREMALY